MPTTRRWYYAPLALLAVLVSKLAVLAQLGSHPLLVPQGELDPAYYVQLAVRVAGGDLAAGDRTYFVSPLYIYFLGAIFRLTGGSVDAARLVQVVLGTAAVALVFETARLWFGRRAAWVAGAIAAATGYFTFNEILILQSALDPFLTAAWMYLLSRAWLQPRIPTAVFAGVALGLHALNRPNLLVWDAAAVLLTAVLVRPSGAGPARGGHGVAATAAGLAAGVALALAPAAVRNYVVAGDVAPVSSHGGLNFYIGNNRAADGTYKAVPGITPSIVGQERDARRVAERSTGRSLTDAEVSSYFYREGWRWIREHPRDALGLAGRKLLYVFNAADISLNYAYAYYSRDERSLLSVLLVGPWLLLPLGLFGILVVRPGCSWLGAEAATGDRPGARASTRLTRSWWALVAFAPIYACSLALFFVAGRYRLPLLVLLVVTAAAACQWLIEAWRRGSRARLVRAALALAALAVLTNWDLGLDDGRAGERTEMILHEVDAHRDAEARTLLERTAPAHPDPASLFFRVGQAYLDRGDAAAAVPLLQRSLAAGATDPAIRLVLGEALLESGQASAAVPHLRAALDANGHPNRAAVDLARALAAAGQRTDALAALDRLTQPEALDAPLLADIGRLALDLGSAAAAERFLRLAIVRDRTSVTAHEWLGVALTGQGRLEEAAESLEVACRLEPKRASAWLNLAVVHAEMGRIEVARREVRNALRLAPDSGRARALLRALGGE